MARSRSAATSSATFILLSTRQCLPGAGILGVVRYLILWVGSYFNSQFTNPFAAGVIAIGIFTAGWVCAITLLYKTRDWRAFYPAALIGTYACATAGITVAGRIGFGVEQALDTRYRVFSLSFYLGIVALLVTLDRACCRHARPSWKRVFRFGCAMAMLTASIGLFGSYLDGPRFRRSIYQRNAIGLRALEWIEVIPDNPDLLRIFPNSEILLSRVRIIRQHKLLRLPFVQDEIAQKVRTAPPADASERHLPRIITCAFDARHRLAITGAACLPDRKRPADCVVVGCTDTTGTFKPVSIIETESWRKDLISVKKRRSSRFARAFSSANIPAGDITISAWAVDLAKKKVYPLGGSTKIRADQR